MSDSDTLVAGFYIDREAPGILDRQKITNTAKILKNAKLERFEMEKDDENNPRHYPETNDQCHQYLAKTKTEFEKGEYDALIFFSSSHGETSKDGKMYIQLGSPNIPVKKRDMFPVENLVIFFGTDSLRDKLKLFVIQACRTIEGTDAANKKPDYFLNINIVDAIQGHQEPHSADSGFGSDMETGIQPEPHSSESGLGSDMETGSPQEPHSSEGGPGSDKEIGSPEPKAKVPRPCDETAKRISHVVEFHPETDALFDDICPENTVILYSGVRGTYSTNRSRSGSWLFGKFFKGLEAIQKIKKEVSVMELIQEVQSNMNCLEEGVDETEKRNGSSSCQHRLTRNFKLKLKEIKKTKVVFIDGRLP